MLSIAHQFISELFNAFFRGCRSAPQSFLHPILTTRRTLENMRLLQPGSSPRTTS